MKFNNSSLNVDFVNSVSDMATKYKGRDSTFLIRRLINITYLSKKRTNQLQTFLELRTRGKKSNLCTLSYYDMNRSKDI